MARVRPNKTFYKIGEVAELVGVPAHVLRYWEAEFPMVKPMKTRGAHRMYRPKDVETLVLIRRLVHEQGYTVDGARKQILAMKGTKARQRNQLTLRDVGFVDSDTGTESPLRTKGDEMDSTKIIESPISMTVPRGASQKQATSSVANASEHSTQMSPSRNEGRRAPVIVEEKTFETQALKEAQSRMRLYRVRERLREFLSSIDGDETRQMEETGVVMVEAAVPAHWRTRNT